ncbi:hemolysin family protein [soil metagenome]
MTLLLLLVTVLLVVVNGALVGAEFALTGARRTEVQRLAEAGDRRAHSALAAMRELPLMLAGAQLGVTMASLALGYVAEPTFAHLIEGVLGSVVTVPPALIHSLSFVLGLGIVVFLHMVFGEMTPKNLTIAAPEKSALWLAWPTRALVAALRPFVHLLNGLARLCLKALRIDPPEELGHSHDIQEIAMIIEQSAREGMLGEGERRLMSGAISFGERDAASVMVPRTELTAIPVTATPADIEKVVLDSGHTRLPVYGQGLDEVLGFLHSKDLLKVDPDDRTRPFSRELIRKMMVVPESRRLRSLLIDMRRERHHLALVIDEHGGTAGVVTLEDVLEEVVGEIRDEHDASELGVEELGADRYLVPGALRIDEAKELIGIVLPRGEYDTVAGFLMDSLGHIPKRRDAVDVGGWRLRVRSMQRRRVVQVLIERVPEPATSGGTDAGGEGE